MTLAAVLTATCCALWLAAAAICAFLLELCELLLWLLRAVLLDASLSSYSLSLRLDLILSDEVLDVIEQVLVTSAAVRAVAVLLV